MDERAVAPAQSCGRDELCVDTGPSVAGPKAYCVNTQNFKRIPNSDREPGPQGMTYEIPVNGSPFAATALLTDESRRSAFMSSYFQLAALRREAGAVVPVESEFCRACYSLKMQPFPAEANLLRGFVRVRRDPAGYLYLITIS